ncbi:uncharacterized protein LOC110465781 [Mizuhopecten yessoensis]|uniref:Uncharacterized protein n=1 Tax=Mizuhopecten yessoensis TaxID=6573 RepID=A0A210PQX6_MIZYE|nr:uncharacterized protein LOC110465781 [Mizuhopecten yessoensis]OWF38891.1 hypothetical protein KP79_PYT23640 [Mizuhopecten yessoensis]
MPEFLDAPLLIKVAAVLEVIAFVINVVAFSTPYWRAVHFEEFRLSDDEGTRLESAIAIQGFDEGLWRRCINSICADLDVAGRDWLQAVRAFESIALLTSCIAMATLLCYIFKADFRRRFLVFLVSAISSIVTGGCILLSVLIYGICVKVALSWSFALAAASGILYGVSGALLQGTFIKEAKEPI